MKYRNIELKPAHTFRLSEFESSEYSLIVRFESLESISVIKKKPREGCRLRSFPKNFVYYKYNLNSLPVKFLKIQTLKTQTCEFVYESILVYVSHKNRSFSNVFLHDFVPLLRNYIYVSYCMPKRVSIRI